MKLKKLFYKRPSLRIATRYSATASLVILLFALLVPKLLNYGPESINTDFDIQMSYIPYWQQFLSIGVLLGAVITGTGFLIYEKNTKNTTQATNQIQNQNQMQMMERPDGETPPEKPNNDENNEARPEPPNMNNKSIENKVN